jgi:hypothetical protein
MRIVSLNLRGFVDWDARLPLIVDYLKREKPFVALFQEAASKFDLILALGTQTMA